jgi:hypothetical protein
VGEKVLLKLQSYAQGLVVNSPFPKLAFKYCGPCQINEKIGSVAYISQLPACSMVHPIFHISQLKQFAHDYLLAYSQ